MSLIPTITRWSWAPEVYALALLPPGPDAVRRPSPPGTQLSPVSETQIMVSEEIVTNATVDVNSAHLDRIYDLDSKIDR